MQEISPQGNGSIEDIVYLQKGYDIPGEGLLLARAVPVSMSLAAIGLLVAYIQIGSSGHHVNPFYYFMPPVFICGGFLLGVILQVAVIILTPGGYASIDGSGIPGCVLVPFILIVEGIFAWIAVGTSPMAWVWMTTTLMGALAYNALPQVMNFSERRWKEKHTPSGWRLRTAMAGIYSPEVSHGDLDPIDVNLKPTIREARRSILHAARSIESDFTPKGAASWWNFRARATAMDGNFRVAALLRQHSEALLRTNSIEDLNRIFQSLRMGKEAAHRNDWPALLENAPAKVKRRRLIFRLLQRLSPGLVLATAAILFPLLPGQADLGATLRTPLLLTALLAVTAKADSATDVVRDAAGKGLWEAAAGKLGG